MERIIVAREAVDQRLLGPGCKFGALVRGRGRHLVRCTRGKRGPAAAAVAPQEGDLGYAGEQGAGCGVGNLARRIEEGALRSEEPTLELQTLMSRSYAVFCMKNKTK